MTTTKDMPVFAELTEEQKTYMERVQIGNVFVTPGQRADACHDERGVGKQVRKEKEHVRGVQELGQEQRDA